MRPVLVYRVVDEVYLSQTSSTTQSVYILFLDLIDPSLYPIQYINIYLVRVEDEDGLPTGQGLPSSSTRPDLIISLILV